jgi:cytosine deaminase
MPVTGFFTPPQAGRYALRRAHVPASLLLGTPPGAAGHDDLVLCDLLIDNGRIAEVAPAGSLDAALGPDLDESLVLPGMLDAHAHLDKGHIVSRARNMTGDLMGAAAASGPDRSTRWQAADVRRRLEFGIRTAYAKGVVAIRTHLDSLAPQPDITFPVLRALREKWAGKVELQPSTICPIDVFLDERGPRPTWWPRWAAISAAAPSSWRPCRRLCRPSSTWRWRTSSGSPRNAGSTSTCMSTNRATPRREP